MRPNMRVQRHPLGSRRVLVGVWLLAATSCVSVEGKLYPAWNAYSIKVSYSSVAYAIPTPTLSIRLVGRWTASLPYSMKVVVYRSGDESSPRYHLDGKDNPSGFTVLPAGTWDLEIAPWGTTQSPNKPARCRVDLRPGQVCTVEVVIVEDQEIVVVSAA